MKFTAVAVAALIAGAVASPASMQEKRRQARANRLAAKSVKKVNHLPVQNKTIVDEFVTYDSNWAGSVITTTGVTTVSGVATVPSVSSGAGAAWVGIDGDSCQNAILQTGFQWDDGEYSAWYEWYPADSFNFNLDVSAGDSISMTVKATSKTAGTATVENLTTGKSVSHSFSGQPSLCETDAEWIVEDFEECEGSSCSLVPFGNFGTIEFTSATSNVGNGGSGSILDIEQSNKVLTSCSASGSTVSCKYE